MATIVRLKYLADIADQTDFLCKFLVIPFCKLRKPLYLRLHFEQLLTYGPVQAVNAGIWTNVELGLSIVAASIVTLRHLLRNLKIRGFSNDDTASNSRRNHHNIDTGSRYGPWASQRSQGRTHISSGLDHEQQSQTELNGIKVSTTVELSDRRSYPESRESNSEELIFEGPRRSSVERGAV